MTDKLKITTEYPINPHGETLLHNGEVFAEFHNPYKSEHLKSQAEADELKIEAARKLLEQAPISPVMRSRNNIDHVSSVIGDFRSELLAREQKFYDDSLLTEKDLTKDEYGVWG